MSSSSDNDDNDSINSSSNDKPIKYACANGT